MKPMKELVVESIELRHISDSTVQLHLSFFARGGGFDWLNGLEEGGR